MEVGEPIIRRAVLNYKLLQMFQTLSYVTNFASLVQNVMVGHIT